MKRSTYRLISWIDAAAQRDGVDPVKQAALVLETLMNRRSAKANWWSHVTQQPRMVRPPSRRAQRALRAHYASLVR